MTHSIIVTSHQMRAIEAQIFANGMPIAALMEKVALLITAKIHHILSSLFSPNFPLKIGVLVGPGHNGGDALVIARELFLKGYKILIYHPFSKSKDLTSFHIQFAQSLSIPFSNKVSDLQNCDLLIDGLFGFGLEKSLSDDLISSINHINLLQKPIISIDIPSGIHTDTGEVLGNAIKADYTLCLGLWKLAFFQDSALPYIGQAHLIDFNITSTQINTVLGDLPPIQLMTKETAIALFPLPRSPLTHKYQQGHLLLICGSKRYAGAAILAALGARASGVGMLSIAVPDSLKSLLLYHVPEALIIGCPETDSGAIARLTDINLSNYDAIACGCGLTKDAENVVKNVLDSPLPLILDADGLNILAHLQQNLIIPSDKIREYPTIFTPHLGEFKRLFPQEKDLTKYRISAIIAAAKESQGIVLLKGAKTAIASPSGKVWIIGESTPALARGGSGDVLTGIMGGLLAQRNPITPIENIVAISAWWHSQAGILAAKERSELGVDPLILTEYLTKVIREFY